MLNSIIVIQGEQQSYESFRKLFNDNPHTLDMSGGRHILYIKEIMDKEGDDPIHKEFKVEEETFKGMFLLNRSDMLNYGLLIEEL